MRFKDTPLEGAWIIEDDCFPDERGTFQRIFCRREFDQRNLLSDLVQCNISRSLRAGTLRGMHFQLPPAQEAKLVRCTSGAIYDVILDLRRDSPTFLNWTAAELTSDNRRSVYVPEGFAHGLLTLSDNTEVLYHVSQYYHLDLSSGVRYDDPAFGLEWPHAPRVINHRDRTWPDFDPQTMAL